MTDAALTPDAFVERLRSEGASRYHSHHPFNVRMHAGALTPDELRRWVVNRYYYQTRIPIKDALIVSKSEDPAFRRAWMRRVADHDGDARADGREGGLFEWLVLARGIGLGQDEVQSCARVLPAVRHVCDSYVELVRTRSLLEAVASSLTEHFAPEIMRTRVAAWQLHYPWVAPEALAYFRSRVPRAARDAEEALAFVVAHATTRDAQEQCVKALIAKCRILWGMLDAVAEAAP
jgi:pyrroloquinoline-quinone synthase